MKIKSVDNSGVVEMTDWWQGGFPEHEKATVIQRGFLQKRLNILMGIISDEEHVAIRMMGTEIWLDSVAKTRATGLIGLIKAHEREQKEQSIANRVAGVAVPVDSISCPSCGGILQGGVGKKCINCGRVSFYVKL